MRWRRLRELLHAGVQISTQIAEAEESNASNASCLVLLNDHCREFKTERLREHFLTEQRGPHVHGEARQQLRQRRFGPAPLD
jgi:hypothetical protein